MFNIRGVNSDAHGPDRSAMVSSDGNKIVGQNELEIWLLMY